MKIRKLTEQGLDAFETFIRALINGNDQNTPVYLLDDEEYSSAVDFDAEADPQRTFESRYEMGVYLVKMFGKQNIQKYQGDPGFWSWFALLWFEQLCPVKDKMKRPSAVHNYVLSRSYNHRPRHAILMTWQLVDKYGEVARFMLCSKPSVRGDITEQLMTRQEMLTAEGVMRLASSLYTDTVQGTFKRGSASAGRGSVRRYVSWIQRLQLTYDIFSLAEKDLAEMLPDEFIPFREENV